MTIENLPDEENIFPEPTQGNIHYCLETIKSQIYRYDTKTADYLDWIKKVSIVALKELDYYDTLRGILR